MSDFHSVDFKKVLKELKTSELGLNSEEAEKRAKKYGSNKLPEEIKRGKFLIFLSQFNNVLIYILLFAGILSILMGESLEAIVIFSAIIINVIIGYFQESKASDAIAKLKKMVEHKAVVIRDGHEMMLDSSEIVVGDIFEIKAGNRVPADARIIDFLNLQVSEAALTGEANPSNKKSAAIALGTGLADRENMLYAGTSIMQGTGRAVVTAIGEKTEIGKIAKMVKEEKEEKTPLQFRLDNFAKFLGIIFAVICILIVIIGIIQKRPIREMIETGIALGVASIPEGLTVSVTFILALGMRQILKKKALTRKLVAAETLGSTTVICTDKTGTLTEGKMKVSHIVIDEDEYAIEDFSDKTSEKKARASNLALQIGMMCNDAVIENPNDELSDWRVIGSSTESALLLAAIQSGLDREKLLKNEKKINTLPFSSESKYMLCLYEKEDGNYILYKKGAPEKVFDKSERFYRNGAVCELDDKERKKLKKTYEALTAKGLRVIGLAMKEIKKTDVVKINFKGENIDWNSVDNDYVFVGFAAIKDPLRKEVGDTIAICRQAGIKPVIITGDHKFTAKSIAEEVGIKARDKNILTGEDLEKMSDEDLKKIIKNINIFARVSPKHKLRIVKAFQERGEVVAMTGDGVNDSPALRAADIGIALGTGTDIAKETSDIILLDDNFSTIVSAIKQGRVIFNNIRKVITFLVSDCLASIILILGSIVFSFPLPVLPVQILWINIINDGLPHFSLAFEKGDDSIMKEKPMQKNEPILNKEMKIIIYGVGFLIAIFIFLIYIIMLKLDFDLSYVRSIIFSMLGATSLMSIFSIRSFKRHIWQYNPFSNKQLNVAVLASFFLLYVGTEWLIFQNLLSTRPLGPGGWFFVFCVGFFNILLIEIVKYFFQKKKA